MESSNWASHAGCAGAGAQGWFAASVLRWPLEGGREGVGPGGGGGGGSPATAVPVNCLLTGAGMTTNEEHFYNLDIFINSV